MITTIALLSAGVAALISVTVVWANPLRRANRALGILAGLGSAHLILVYQAIKVGQEYIDDTSLSAVPWLRWIAVIDTLFPFLTSLLRNCIAEPRASASSLLRKNSWWLLFAASLSVLAFTGYFLPSDSTPLQWKRGPGYSLYGAALSGAFIAIGLQAMRDTRKLSGIRKIEMQFFVLNVCICGLVTILLANIGTMLGALQLRRLTVLAFLASFGVMSIEIAFHRIFNVRQVLVSIILNSMVVAALAGTALTLSRVIAPALQSSSAHLLSTVIVILIALYIGRKSRAWPELAGTLTAESLRIDLIKLARSETSTASLIARFEQLLCEQTGSLSATLLFQHGEIYAGQTITITKIDAVYRSLMERGWATPESLERIRPTPDTDELRIFMGRHDLALLVATPRGSETPSLLLALGLKFNDWPYTYPEIESLWNVAELMDNILTHSRLANQAALQAKMEHLAMMSRGLAHDLKNLITPVASFLLHTDGQYLPGSAEAEVHAAARHSIRVMNEYVREALFFSERLEPVFRPIDPLLLFESVRKIMADRAAARSVTIRSAITREETFPGDKVLVERMLANLVANAIDASPPGSTVVISVSTPSDNAVRFEVADSGTGIPLENLGRIFEPYFTTKQFGDDLRGFGLGLTICQKIVNLHAGTINVQSEAGKGTTVTVEFPIRPGPHLLPSGPCLALP